MSEQAEMSVVNMTELRAIWSKRSGYELRRKKAAELVATGMSGDEVEHEMRMRYGICVGHSDLNRMVAEHNATKARAAAKTHAGQFKPGQSGNPGGRPKVPKPSNAELMEMLKKVMARLDALNGGCNV
jgi:hypothetical protein